MGRYEKCTHRVLVVVFQIGERVGYVAALRALRYTPLLTTLVLEFASTELVNLNYMNRKKQYFNIVMYEQYPISLKSIQAYTRV